MIAGIRRVRKGSGMARLVFGMNQQPKWVVSRSLKSVGPNATLVADDLLDHPQ
jgi:hypothetical protein